MKISNKGLIDDDDDDGDDDDDTSPVVVAGPGRTQAFAVYIYNTSLYISLMTMYPMPHMGWTFLHFGNYTLLDNIHHWWINVDLSETEVYHQELQFAEDNDE